LKRWGENSQKNSVGKKEKKSRAHGSELEKRGEGVNGSKTEEKKKKKKWENFFGLVGGKKNGSFIEGGWKNLPKKKRDLFEKGLASTETLLV